MTLSLPFEEFIVIVAPCPLGASAREGWMSRIRAVDNLFADMPRIYIDPFSGAPEGPLVPKVHGPKALEYRVALTRADHHALLEALIIRCRFVYVHTAHLGRFLLPFYPTGKIITDMHGIVPEEERMHGRQTVGTYYEGVERVILKNSRVIVVVTDAMRDHLLAKHPDSNATFVCLPIIEDYPGDLTDRKPRLPGTPYRTIYAGGIQVWQNIEATIDLADKTAEFASFEFLSVEHDKIKAMSQHTSIVDKAKFGVVGKDELPGRYLDSDFGCVLRDDTAVNRVSCPTKLSEYLWFGVIPIVKTPHIGDFAAEGYCYVTDEEFAAGLIPDEATCDVMRKRNRQVLDRLVKRFEAGSATLRSLHLPNLVHENTLAGLPIANRHLLFPNQAELYLFAGAMHHFVRDVIDVYDEMHWQPDVAAPVGTIRLVPLVGDISVELQALELTVVDAPPAGLSASCATLGQANGSAIRMTRAAPYIDINLSSKLVVRNVKARWVFHGGDAAPSTPGLQPRIDITVRQVDHADTAAMSIPAPIAFLGTAA